jgi:monoterpene epsilon-lactone hydrolase
LTLFVENLHRLPPLLVEFGECEVLHDQIMQFCKKVEESGVNIEYNVREDMVHVFPIYSFTGMKQCSDAFEAIVNFLNTTHPHTKG